MIDIDGGVYYITSGGACYIMRTENGVLRHVCFGKRVEQEDDMPSLVRGTSNEIAAADIAVRRGGKRVKLALTVKDFKVTEKSAADVPTLRGDSALAVTLEDRAAGVEVISYYTPYTRGGIARRVCIKNTADAPLGVDRLATSVAVSGGAASNGDGLMTVNTECGAYGFFPLYSARALEATGSGIALVTVGKNSAGDNDRQKSGGIVLGAGEELSSAELFAVFSDNGEGGVVRAFHDIFREYGEDGSGRRRPIVLYCPTDGGMEKFSARVAAACEIGVDTVVVDRAARGVDFTDAARFVHESGLGFGLRADWTESDRKRLEACVRDTCAEYLELLSDGVNSYADAVRFNTVYSEMRREFPDTAIEIVTERTGGADARLHACAHSPLPLFAVRNAVTLSGDEFSSLKTAFDVATLGGLGYRLDPAVLNADARRAIRAQVFSYQDDAGVIEQGDVYDIGGGIMTVSKDKSKAYAVAVGDVRLVGLDEHNLYHVRELGKTFSGAALAFYGIPAPTAASGETFTYHIRQVADYEQ